jgi:two-component system, NtrC family, nitrogen regulation sensor histidine kinase NtrY
MKPSFTFSFFWRIALLMSLIALSALAWVAWRSWLPVVFLGFLAAISAYNLHEFVNETNRRLARLFESVRYSDFAIRFPTGKEKGASFEAVNKQFNAVLESFRQTRAEKEANLLFINTVVQNLSAGIMVFDAQKNVLLSNNSALQVLGLYRLHHLNDLPENHQALHEFVQNLSNKGKMLYQSETGRQLSVQGVQMNLQGRLVWLITLQNIHPELQEKELDAWRNLTRVLRHEIMNSVTPIVSLVKTMQEIVRQDLKKTHDNASLEDLEEALEVVASRGSGLVDFVEAYRTFTSIPQPHFASVSVKKLLDNVVHLTDSEMQKAKIKVNLEIKTENLEIQVDVAQIEMVLINLLKNAREAFENTPISLEKMIKIIVGKDAKNHVYIEVIDNGSGIEPDLLQEIFIPFYTTKLTGSGVGLSISRQIMQMHGGDIQVESELGVGTKFVLGF